MKKTTSAFVLASIMCALTISGAQAQSVTVYFDLQVDSIDMDEAGLFADNNIAVGSKFRGSYEYDPEATNFDEASNGDNWFCSGFSVAGLPGDFSTSSCSVSAIHNPPQDEYLVLSYYTWDPNEPLILLRFVGDFGYDTVDLGCAGGHLIQDPPIDVLGTPMPNTVLSVEDASALPSIANMTATLFVTYPASWVHEDLHDAVVGVGPGDSLANKIAIVEAYLAASDEEAACAMLADFRSQVSAQSGKKIDEDVATQFLADAQEVMDAIPCQ